MTTTNTLLKAYVRGVNGNIVRIEVPDGSFMKNEVAFVHWRDRLLKSEVLRIFNRSADLQVFEETDGICIGDEVTLSGELLSVSLGPGLLGNVYDGLQNPLEKLAEIDGFFLQRGRELPALDEEREWDFKATCKIGDHVRAGDCIGIVTEKAIEHKIMIPFDEADELEIFWIGSGSRTITEPVIRVRDHLGNERSLTMQQQWPVRYPIPEKMIRRKIVRRGYPDRPLTTTIRVIDTFFPIAKGGTACIPGPFGAGKTVLQSLIARYSSVDVVVVVACGERAGEVLETIREFAKMKDPRTGNPLMDRTVIICNTSSMPVPAREASIYTGITLGEYYRQMGHDVLLIADSTSRWAQAMRETSGRLEEIPGEDAYPAYLDSAIRSVYERAGVIENDQDISGSLTMIGTVSPAGGNFEEPVTQSTLSTVKTFLGLSYDRAYKRFYPAIDPLKSWSRYFDQLREYYDTNIDPHWVASVNAMQQLLEEGEKVARMMQVTGDEGVTIEDFVTYQKSILIDMAFLQQDAFDPVDVSVPTERQIQCFNLLRRYADTPFDFDDKETARNFFVQVTGLFKNLNYSATGSDDYDRYWSKLESFLD